MTNLVLFEVSLFFILKSIEKAHLMAIKNAAFPWNQSDLTLPYSNSIWCSYIFYTSTDTMSRKNTIKNEKFIST